MARYFSYLGFQFFFRFTLVGALLVACRPGSDEPSECRSDSDCTSSDARCLDEVCVECIQATDCECFEICNEDNSCEALGAESDQEAPNAHGNWSTNPSNPNYSFIDYCQADDDCSLGELCNGATGGCVLAADYPQSCTSDDDCSRGPSGETLSCDQTRSLCLPAAKCIDEQQCCNRSNVVCSQTQGLCLPIQDECTPTPREELESTCPISPRATDECPEGLFCSNDGLCVQCQCNDDCSSPALKCRIYDGTCVPNSYCEQNSDCVETEVCKTDVNECVERCDPNTADSCPVQSFCDPETLYCRNNSERPCIEDAFSPNHSPVEASPLEISIGDDYIGEFALCNEQTDYFALTFDAPSELQVFISADERLEVLYELLGADNQTVIASGFVGELGAELLTTTIGTAATRILRVTPLNQTEGFYTLNISTTTAETCVALGDSPTNDTPASATTLWSDLDAQDCTAQQLGTQTSFSCPINSLNLCPGDLDFYRWELPGNSRGRLAISSSSESIEVNVYGPIAEGALSGPLLLPSQNEIGFKLYDFSSRNPETYLIGLSDPTSQESLYTLSGELNSAGSCPEDLFDNESAATSGEGFGVQDEAGQNDVTPTNLLLEPGLSTIPTNICVNDVDWFSIRSLERPDLFPRGQIITIDWSEDLKPEVNINGILGTLPIEFISQEDSPIELQLTNPTDNQLYSGNLVVRWELPAPCTTPAEASPSGALIPSAEPSETSGTITHPASWCGFEDKWYLFTVPANRNLELSATSENASFRIEFHDDSIRSLDSSTFDLPLGLSLLSTAPTTLAEPQLGFLTASPQSRIVYARVTNTSGATDTNLSLNWRFFENLCTPDGNEDDDRIAEASVIGWVDGGFASSGVLSACPGDDDWFEVSIGDSSLLDAQLLTPSASELTFELYDGSLNRLNWETVSSEPGSRYLRFTPNQDTNGSYFARVRSLSPLSAYRIDFQADGVCVDDVLESLDPALLMPETALDSLKLCNDNDEFSVSGLANESWNICVQFDHSEIDIDIQLETTSGALIATSATKEDLESISFNSSEDETYILRVYADLRSSGIGTYNVVLQTAPCTSQP